MTSLPAREILGSAHLPRPIRWRFEDERPDGCFSMPVAWTEDEPRQVDEIVEAQIGGASGARGHGTLADELRFWVETRRLDLPTNFRRFFGELDTAVSLSYDHLLVGW